MMKEPTEPRTSTEARRHRPSTKKQTKASAAPKAAASPARKRRSLRRKRRVAAEDKRESTAEVVTDARPRNLKADSNSRKDKGSATRALEATTPGDRPSRKSTRRGANGAKPDSQQRRQVMRKVRSPKSRHSMTS